jgi:cell division protein FtsN
MEQQKILWILFAAAFLLIVAVGVGLLWFMPPSGQGITLKPEETRDAEISDDPIEWIRSSETFFQIEAAEETEEEFKAETLTDEVPASSESVSEVDEKDATTVEVPLVTPAATSARRSTPTSTQTTVAQQSPAEPRASTVAAPKKTTPRTITVTEYWIQVASYKSSYRAEQLKEALSEKGFPCRIISKDVNDELYFRVRSGPYANENEAKKFLGWIQELSGYENSYISQVYVQKTVN